MSAAEEFFIEGGGCPHESCSGIDTAPIGTEKVWRCDACGWLHTLVPSPENPLIVLMVAVPPSGDPVSEGG